MANIFTQKPFQVKPKEDVKDKEIEKGFSSKDKGFSSIGTGTPEQTAKAEVIRKKSSSGGSKSKSKVYEVETKQGFSSKDEGFSSAGVGAPEKPKTKSTSLEQFKQLSRYEQVKQEAERAKPREALYVRIDDVPFRDVESRNVSPIFTRSKSEGFVETSQGISKEGISQFKRNEQVERLQADQFFRDVELSKPKPKSGSEKFVDVVSDVVDFPVSKTKEFYIKSPEWVKSFVAPVPSLILKPSQRDVFVTTSVDIGSYFTPYYGVTRFAKDVGVYGFRVSQKPSYIYEEGKFETLGLIGVGAIAGGSKAYKSFKSDPLLSEFGSIKQSGQFSIFRKSVSRDASARFVSKGDELVVGSDPLNVNQIVKSSKITTIVETPKTLVTEFKVKDSGLFVSRKGSRTSYLDVETGSTRIVDVFDVSRFGIKSSYTRVSKTSGDIINTQVFKLSSGKKIYDISGVSNNLLIGLSKTGESFGFRSPYADNSRLVSFETASERSKVFSGTKEGGLLADISRTRSVDKITKLDKQYTVFFKEELGLVASKRGVSVKPISSSVEQKTILQFGKPAFVPNVRTLEGSRIVGVKYPQSVDIVKVSESLDIKFSQVYKPQAELIVKNNVVNELPKVFNLPFGTKIYVGARTSDPAVSGLGNYRGGLTTIFSSKKAQVQIPKSDFTSIYSNPASVSKSFSSFSFSGYSGSPSSSFKPVFINTSKPDSINIPNVRDRVSPFSSIKPSLVVRPKRDVINVPSSSNIPNLDVSVKPDVFIKVKSRPVLEQQLKQESLLRQEAKLEQEVVPKVVTTTIPKIKTPFIKFPLVKFGGFAYAKLPSSKSKFKGGSSFSFKPLESVNVPKRLDIFPSLQEVFRYEWTTGKESIMPKKTRKIKEVFESQYFGRGNFGAIIPVEQERKKFKY